MKDVIVKTAAALVLIGTPPDEARLMSIIAAQHGPDDLEACILETLDLFANGKVKSKREAFKIALLTLGNLRMKNQMAECAKQVTIAKGE